MSRKLFAASYRHHVGEQADAKTNQVKNFLRELRAGSSDEKFRTAAEFLLLLLDRRTITSLSNEIRNVRLIWKKGEINAKGRHNFIPNISVSSHEQRI